VGAQILVDLGVTTMRLMTNNTAKYGGLEGFGLEIVDRVPLIIEPNPHNAAYLATKRERMGHLFEYDAPVPEPVDMPVDLPADLPADEVAG
jgi:3,4-dihydroxy 2-butanone 4-phosphate synthase/GTP cyclohydrolase II